MNDSDRGTSGPVDQGGRSNEELARDEICRRGVSVLLDLIDCKMIMGRRHHEPDASSAAPGEMLREDSLPACVSHTIYVIRKSVLV